MAPTADLDINASTTLLKDIASLLLIMCTGVAYLLGLSLIAAILLGTAEIIFRLCRAQRVWDTSRVYCDPISAIVVPSIGGIIHYVFCIVYWTSPPYDETRTMSDIAAGATYFNLLSVLTWLIVALMFIAVFGLGRLAVMGLKGFRCNQTSRAHSDMQMDSLIRDEDVDEDVDETKDV